MKKLLLICVVLAGFDLAPAAPPAPASDEPILTIAHQKGTDGGKKKKDDEEKEEDLHLTS